MHHGTATRSSYSFSFSMIGFYGVTYYLGFRDDYDVRVEDVIERICVLESTIGGHNPEALSALLAKIRSVSQISTHMCVSLHVHLWRSIRLNTATFSYRTPHYHVLSKPVGGGRLWSPVATWVRRSMLEGVYHRMGMLVLRASLLSLCSIANHSDHVPGDRQLADIRRPVRLPMFPLCTVTHTSAGLCTLVLMR